MHHIQDAREIELPFGAAIHLPAEGSWMVGPVDLTPTKHVVFIWAAGVLTLLLLLPAARRARRAHGESPKGGHNVIEAAVLFFRDQVVMPNVGHGGEKYAPFVITLFFFIGLALAFIRKEKAAGNPWGVGATTLEWTLPSPPAYHAYETLPRIAATEHH